MQHLAMIVAEDLHFDVPCARQIFLDENGGVAKRAERLALRFLKKRVELPRFAHDAHAAPTAAHRGFQHHGKAELRGGAARIFRRTDGRVGSGQHGHADRSGQAPRRRFVAEHFKKFRRRPDEGDAGLQARAREGRIFGEESVAGMNRVHIFFERQRNDAVDVQIRFDRAFARADQIRFIGFKAMQAEPVFLRINRDRAQAEFVCGAQDADGDLTAIGCQDFLHVPVPNLSRSRGPKECLSGGRRGGGRRIKSSRPERRREFCGKRPRKSG